jgi:hypothetical protein
VWLAACAAAASTRIGVTGGGGSGSAGNIVRTAGSNTVGSPATNADLHVGYGAGSSGAFTLAGGTLNVPAVTVKANGQFNFNGGTLGTTALTLAGGGRLAIGRAREKRSA